MSAADTRERMVMTKRTVHRVSGSSFGRHSAADGRGLLWRLGFVVEPVKVIYSRTQIKGERSQIGEPRAGIPQQKWQALGIAVGSHIAAGAD